MFVKIQRDQSRFKQIVRGKVRENLRKYVTHGEMIGRKGRDLVSDSLAPARRASFPLRQERLGRRRPGRGRSKASRSARASRKAAPARPAANRGPTSRGRSHARRIGRDPGGRARPCRGSSPRANRTWPSPTPATPASARIGPESLRHFKRTYMQALRRQISSNVYVPHNPRIIPIREDKRYRSWTDVLDPQANAVIIYLMDVSGSMTDDQKEIVRTAGFLARYLAEEPIRRRGNPLHHPRRGGQGSRRADRSTTPAKAAARGSARPTRFAPT